MPRLWLAKRTSRLAVSSNRIKLTLIKQFKVGALYAKNKLMKLNGRPAATVRTRVRLGLGAFRAAMLAKITLD